MTPQLQLEMASLLKKLTVTAGKSDVLWVWTAVLDETHRQRAISTNTGVDAVAVATRTTSIFSKQHDCAVALGSLKHEGTNVLVLL